MFYWPLRFLFKFLFIILTGFKVEGLENIPQKANFIVVANHTSFLDSAAISSAIPKKINWLATRILYNKIPWIKWICEKTDALITGSSSESAIALLSKNKNVGLFPEGECREDGKLGNFKTGAALFALKTGRPILPCAVMGAYETLPYGKVFLKLNPKAHPIKVKIGKPIYLLKEFNEIVEDIDLQEGILKTKKSIKVMLNAG